MHEKRRAMRVNARLSVMFTDLRTGQTQRALTKDISAVGVCLLTHDLLPPGTPVSVELHLPDSTDTVKFLAEVIWSWPLPQSGSGEESTTAQAGMTVISIDPKDRLRVMQYAQLNVTPETEPESDAESAGR
jgi:hypothetical protein